jgi:hypothetical protein
VKLPGVMATLVAPLVDHFNVLVEPEEIVTGFAVKELIDGLLAAFTVTVTVDVAEPAAFIAVSVYVVVAVGLMLVVPLADVEVNVPGVMLILVAPLVAQVSVLLLPESIAGGLAENDAIDGAEPFPDDEFETPQLASPRMADRRTVEIQHRRGLAHCEARSCALSLSGAFASALLL